MTNGTGLPTGTATFDIDPWLKCPGLFCANLHIDGLIVDKGRVLDEVQIETGDIDASGVDLEWPEDRPPCLR